MKTLEMSQNRTFSNTDFQQCAVETLLRNFNNFNLIKFITLLKTQIVESLLNTVVENSVENVVNFNSVKQTRNSIFGGFYTRVRVRFIIRAVCRQICPLLRFIRFVV